MEDDRWVRRREFDRKQEGWKMTAGWGGVRFAASSVSAYQLYDAIFFSITRLKKNDA